MQSEVQCPNCRSFKTKSTTQNFRLMMMVISVITLIFCWIDSLYNTIVGFDAMVMFAALLIGGSYATKYFILKKNSAKCKACNYKWDY